MENKRATHPGVVHQLPQMYTFPCCDLYPTLPDFLRTFWLLLLLFHEDKCRIRSPFSSRSTCTYYCTCVLPMHFCFLGHCCIYVFDAITSEWRFFSFFFLHCTSKLPKGQKIDNGESKASRIISILFPCNVLIALSAENKTQELTRFYI